MAGLKAMADRVAELGRHGDSELVHMNPDEIAILEELTGRKMTVNPQTGMPEAFSLWKLLAGIGAVIAAIPTGGISLIGAMGVGTGLTAGITAAATAIGSGLIGSSFQPKNDTSATGSEAAKYLATRNATEAKKNPGIPLIQANLNGPPAYSETGREQQQISYGPPKPPAPMTGGGIQSLMGPVNYAQGGRLEPEEMQARQIVEAAMAAVNGDRQDPHADLSKFVETYGEDALHSLARGGMVRGPGAGLDDMVSAQLGNQKVLLSNDEFVVPADVVSGLGDGSSEAGARKLQAMMGRVRAEKTGSTKQPGRISEKAMPR